jgi:hypothetical protein
MKTATLTRMSDDLRQTLGVLTSTDEQGFTCKTLELPWRANEASISCIPKGEYICKYTRSKRISEAKGRDVFTYEILNVPDRAGVRINAANYSHQLRGCIALGSGIKDIDMDGMNDVTHSGDTIKAFEKFMNYQDFILIIK